jgi:transcriptional activator HAC1
VSVGRTTALDGFNFSDNNVSNFVTHSGSNPTYQFNYFDAPQPTESDMSIFENRVLPLTDNFDLNFDHLAYNHDSVINDFNIEDYLHHDENNQPAPDAQSSDSLAESIASLQPQLGASTYGCDDGGNAVSI